jgi:predicted secreted Zn-dependent protease
LTGIRIDFESTIRVPEWRKPADAPAELVTAWQSYIAALDDHEREHERIALTMAGDLVQRLERMSDLSCRQLGVDARREAETMSQRMQERQAQFDRDTQHGATQGVRWPPTTPGMNNEE